MRHSIERCERYYLAWRGSLVRLQPVLLLAIRLYWGWQFFLTGRGKLMHIERTAEFFDALGIPLPLVNAYAAGTVECVGGLLLLVGAASRLVAVALAGTMLVAYVTAHGDQLGGLFTDPDAFVSAPPFLFLLASLIVLLFGPGLISADGLIARWRGARRSSATALGADVSPLAQRKLA